MSFFNTIRKVLFYEEIHTEITINASKEKVWRILMDLDSYSEWNTYIQEISPALTVGEKIKVFAKPPDGTGRVFYPIVLKVDKYRQFRWIAKFWIPYIFSGEHVFEIHPEGENRIRFTQYEYFKGLNMPLYRLFRKKYTLSGFTRMNEDLKARAEADS